MTGRPRLHVGYLGDGSGNATFPITYVSAGTSGTPSISLYLYDNCMHALPQVY